MNISTPTTTITTNLFYIFMDQAQPRKELHAT